MILIPTTLTIATISIIWYHLTGNKRWLRYQRLRIAFKMVMNARYGIGANNGPRFDMRLLEMIRREYKIRTDYFGGIVE